MGRKRLTVPALALAVAVVVAVAGFLASGRWLSPQESSLPGSAGYAASELELIKNPATPADKIVNGAKTEAINAVSYDASYVSIAFPNGDVSSDRGACTDVVIRALRNAGYDLQRLIYEDKRRSLRSYPVYSNAPRLDPNIDHRRVPNQMAFLRRHGAALPTEVTDRTLDSWKRGDIVYWKIPMDHCGVLSNDRNERGVPLVIHNCSVAAQEDCLTRWPIIGHFRFPVRQAASRRNAE